MEVRGENFVKNIEIESEKAKLDAKKDYLNNQKEQSVILNSNDTNYDDFINEDIEDNELDDIKLDEKNTNKQSYIILAFALILLFLITIIIIRLVSSPTKQENINDNTFIQNDTQEEIITKVNNEVVNINNTDQSLNIHDIEKNEEIISNNDVIVNKNIKEKELKDNIFEISKTEELKKQKVIKKEPIEIKAIKKEKINPYKHIVVKKDNKKESKSPLASTSKIRGYYIQVGAFSKKPNNKLLNKLSNAGLNYKLYKVTIKGKKYIKLLVGPYKTYNIAKTKLSKVRRVSNNKKAYIKRFK